jgi:hypothetical protein
VLAVVCAASVAALVLVVLAPLGTPSRAELVSAPFVLGGGGPGSVLQELIYEHATDRGAARVYDAAREGARGRVRARATRARYARHSAGRAQQLDEVNDPDDPVSGSYKWRDPATLEQEENTFDDEAEYPTAAHEWKGAGEPEENVMDYEGSTEWPDEPSEGTHKWRDPASLEQEENTFDDEREYPTAAHQWKGAGEPEENVFENVREEEDGAKKMQGGAKQAALGRVRDKARSQASQRLEQVAQEQLQHEKQQLDKAAQQKEQLEDKLDKRDKQLESVTKELLAEKQRVAQVEKEAQGHIWRRQHSPVNVLETVYPQVSFAPGVGPFCCRWQHFLVVLLFCCFRRSLLLAAAAMPCQRAQNPCSRRSTGSGAKTLSTSLRPSLITSRPSQSCGTNTAQQRRTCSTTCRRRQWSGTGRGRATMLSRRCPPTSTNGTSSRKRSTSSTLSLSVCV